MLLEKKVFNINNLILKVNHMGYDPSVLRLGEWDRYLDILCEGRIYQKEAILSTLIFLFGKRYSNIFDLVKENYKNNSELQDRYKTLEEYKSCLQLPNLLSSTVDLATGTGKSYVIFGIAQLALGLGLVKKVLVLCPSITIEKGLLGKFNELNANFVLSNAIPPNAFIKNPNIKDASTTIKHGDICVENIHAVYSRTQSSIIDSFGFGKGNDCLVLSDEAHHIYNSLEGTSEETKSIKKWKEFLLNDSFGFQYIVGFTGTAYIDNEYFNDVIYRYSLKDAMSQRVVKMIFYTSKDEDQADSTIKFQKIYQNHQSNIDIYKDVKPLTLLVTKDIRSARQLYALLCEFLVSYEGITPDEAKKKILIVTSHKDHKLNVTLELPLIDQTSSTFQYVISVAMLTEGWDVKNVFQIVPMEERAFNSKLLIAQVLGRGLRVPSPYPRAQVTVFNHDSWSGKIKSLVEEILEIEVKITSSTLGDEGRGAKFHFTLHNLDYDRDETLKQTKNTQVFDYSKELIRLQSQTPEFDTMTQYENIEGSIITRTYKVRKDSEPVGKVVNKIFEEFQNRKFEGIALKLKDGEYTSTTIPKEAIERIIRNSMAEAQIDDDELSIANKQTIFSSFNTLLRKKPKSVTFKRKANPFYSVTTSDRRSETISIGLLKKEATVFYTENYSTEIVNPATQSIFTDLKEDREFRGAFMALNEYSFKTPVDIVFTNSRPEEDFIKNLTKVENAEKISAWIKSRSQNFYHIEYSLTRHDSTHTKKQQLFNPDFFILKTEGDLQSIIVVEIKADDDVSDENKAKFKYAKQHFFDLNELLKESGVKQNYIFHFLSPNNYTEFFDHLRNGKLLKGQFRSALDNLLCD